MTSSPVVTLFRQVLHTANGKADPHDAMAGVFDKLIEATCADAGCLFALDLANSTYSPVLTSGLDDVPDALFLDDLAEPAEPPHFEYMAIGRKAAIIYAGSEAAPASWWGFVTFQTFLVLPILRGDQCLGLVWLACQSENALSEEDVLIVEACASCFPLLFEKQRILAIFETFRSPVNLDQPLRAFLFDLLQRMVTAAGMPYILIWRQDKVTGALECAAHWGFASMKDHSEYVLDIPHPGPKLREVLSGGTPILIPDVSLHSDLLPQCPEIRHLRSYVLCRLPYDTETYGLILFGCETPFNYSLLEVALFDNITATIAAELLRYTSVQTRHEDMIERARRGQSITALEVAQVARHEAKHHIDDAAIALELIRLAAEKKSKEDIQQVLESCKDLEGLLIDISNSLDKIKAVTKPPTRERKLIVLQDVWQSAFNIVLARLNFDQISFRYSPGKVQCFGNEDFLLQAFLNLILNSIDAFREQGRKNKMKQIVVAIEQSSDNAAFVKIRYSDNATGIDPSKLRSVSGDDVRLEDIFRAGVTSKPDGSGYGLYLVRKIIHDQNGSVKLIGHRNGATFDILLPKSLSPSS